MPLIISLQNINPAIRKIEDDIYLKIIRILVLEIIIATCGTLQLFFQKE